MVKKMNVASSLVEVVDRILEIGIIIDKFLGFLQSRSYSLFSVIFQIFQNIRSHTHYKVHISFHQTKGVCM